MDIVRLINALKRDINALTEELKQSKQLRELFREKIELLRQIPTEHAGRFIKEIIEKLRTTNENINHTENLIKLNKRHIINLRRENPFLDIPQATVRGAKIRDERLYEDLWVERLINKKTGKFIPIYKGTIDKGYKKKMSIKRKSKQTSRRRKSKQTSRRRKSKQTSRRRKKSFISDTGNITTKKKSIHHMIELQKARRISPLHEVVKYGNRKKGKRVSPIKKRAVKRGGRGRRIKRRF